MKQGDIYWANLNPVQGNEQAGLRPVVIISGNTMNENLGVCIVCPLSSKIKNYYSCVLIQKNKSNNLSADSEVIPFQIRTLAQERLENKIGVISEQQLREIFKGLTHIFKY